MASYHCQVKAVQRSKGRSATAAAAYRSGERITCDREGRVHDYTRRKGVTETFIIAPREAPSWAQDRACLWNAAEAAERRKDAKVGREWEVALPHELSAAARRELVRGYAAELVERYGVAADVAIHAPGREGDRRNHHAHILVTTRRIGPDGLTEKTRVLDVPKTSGREVEETRQLWAEMQNRALERAEVTDRVDHRSIEAQRSAAEARNDQAAAGRLERQPERHMGPIVASIERRAQQQAEAQGRPYEAVTGRGQEVQEARRARGFLERLKGIRGKLRESGNRVRETLQRLRQGQADRGGEQMNENSNDRAKGAQPSLNHDGLHGPGRRGERTAADMTRERKAEDEKQHRDFRQRVKDTESAIGKKKFDDFMRGRAEQDREKSIKDRENRARASKEANKKRNMSKFPERKSNREKSQIAISERSNTVPQKVEKGPFSEVQSAPRDYIPSRNQTTSSRNLDEAAKHIPKTPPAPTMELTPDQGARDKLVRGYYRQQGSGRGEEAASALRNMREGRERPPKPRSDRDRGDR